AEVVALSADDGRGEVLRLRDPPLPRPEERLHDDEAADREVLVPRDLSSLEACDTLAQVVQRQGAVLPAEGVPGDADGEVDVVLEEAAAGDRVPRALQLEEHEVAAA